MILPFTIPEFQHQDHKEWLSKIDFYQDEIKIFQKELATVLHHHFDLYSIIEHVDEYRAILLKKLQKLDEMRRQIVLHEKAIAQNIDKNKVVIWDHLEVKKAITDFEKSFTQLKDNFRHFVSHHISKP